MTQKKMIIAANWKMNGTRHTITDWLNVIKTQADSSLPAELIIFPPAIFLDQVQSALTGTLVKWGGQNFHFVSSGAFTGEISSNMLCEFGCQYVLIGHSERRCLFGETDSQVGLKYEMALQAGLKPIVCIGETLEEHRRNFTSLALRKQLEAIFSIPDKYEHLHQLVIAYEPIWAIGSGLTAEPAQVQAIHAQIRNWVAQYDKVAAENLSILYGGSLKRENARHLLAMPDVNGGLVGGASLNPLEFLDIVQSCSN